MSTTYHFIGDVHGNLAQLERLLLELGYTPPSAAHGREHWSAPPGCQLVSVGDLVDRGPDSLGCLHLVRRMVQAGHAHLVLGNHEAKAMGLIRARLGLAPGPAGPLSAGRMMTWVQLLGRPQRELRELLSFLEATPASLRLADGAVVVSHARWDPGFASLEPAARVRACAFGRVQGERRDRTKEPGSASLGAEPWLELPPDAPLPERARWVRAYRAEPIVVWGHQIVRRGSVVRIGRTVNVESGCFDGHALSAWAWPSGGVTQAHGAIAWRARLTPYRPAASIIFPAGLTEVRELLATHALRDVGAYLRWFHDAIAAAGAPPPFPELSRAHRALAAAALDGL